MKKLSIFFAAILFSLVFSIAASAQIPVSYYLGKWSVNVEVPGGAKTMVILFEDKGGKLSGGVIDATTNKVTAPFTKVEQTDEVVTVYFMMSAHNVYMTVEKKDDKAFTGSMLDMFDCTGTKLDEKPAQAK